MQGSVRKKGATWSYRIELGMAAGKRNQVERSGFKTKSEATKAMNEVIYNYNMTGDFVENKKITFKEVYNEFIEKEAPATRAYAIVVRYLNRLLCEGIECEFMSNKFLVTFAEDSFSLKLIN